MKLSVIGTGYVGLVQGAVFAEIGHDVVCVDSLEDKIKSIEDFCRTGNGELPIHEPGLPDIVRTNYDNGRLAFSADLKKAVRQSDAIFVCVGTPTLEDGGCDMRHVYNVAGQIGEAMNYRKGASKIIVTKSTVPPNTYRGIAEILSSKTENKFYVVSNPEFMAQGRAVDDCRCPSRIVIGSDSRYAIKKMKEIYDPIVKKRNVKVREMSNIDAELSKYCSNTYLAVQIDATNKFAKLSRELGGDWGRIKESIKDDKRIGRFVHQGLGFGGSCFEKDVLALSHAMKEAGLEESDWLNRVIEYNKKQRLVMVPKIENYFSGKQNKSIAVWGLSFKPDTNDIRGAASIPSIIKLVSSGFSIKAYDPAAMCNAQQELESILKCDPEKKGITFCKNKKDALVDSNALYVTCEWTEFMNVDFNEIKRLLYYPAIFDGKDIYSPETMKEYGFDYFSIGRPDVRR